MQEAQLRSCYLQHTAVARLVLGRERRLAGQEPQLRRPRDSEVSYYLCREASPIWAVYIVVLIHVTGTWEDLGLDCGDVLSESV